MKRGGHERCITDLICVQWRRVVLCFDGYPNTRDLFMIARVLVCILAIFDEVVGLLRGTSS